MGVRFKTAPIARVLGYSNLEKGQEIVEFLPCSSTIEEYTASLEHSCYKSNAEEVVWRIECVVSSRDRRPS